MSITEQTVNVYLPNTRDEVIKKAQKETYNHGMEFESSNDLALTKKGVVTKRERILTLDGLKISDHSFHDVWVESTTHIDKKRSLEFKEKIKNLKSTHEANHINHYVILLEKKIRSNAKQLLKCIDELKREGWIVVQGLDEINAFVEIVSDKYSSISNGKIKKAKPKMVKLDDLIRNPLNRPTDEDGVVNIAKSIVRNGFITCVFAVPYYENGKFTGKYMLFEGHHRYDASIVVRDVWGFDDMNEVPCVIVDWITTEQMDELGNMLIKINVEYKKWTLKDYIQSHFKQAKLLKKMGIYQDGGEVLKDKIFSYGCLEDWRKKSNTEKVGQNTLLYIVGPKSKNSNNLDVKVIEDGEYKINKSEVDDYIKPFLEPTISFHKEIKNKDWYQVGVYRDFCSEIYKKFKNDDIDLKAVKLYYHCFQSVDPKPEMKKNMDGDFWKQIQYQVDNLKGLL